MKHRNLWMLTVAGAVLLAIGMSVPAALAEDDSAPAPEAAAAGTSEPQAGPTVRPALDGAKVYAWTCGSCHSERWPKERSDEEWDVIMTHMRVRASLTAEQTDAVLTYLKENN